MMNEQDHARVAAAIRAAEENTDGEIVCTISFERHRYAEWVLALAATLAFALPVLSTLLGFGPSEWVALLGVWQAEPLTDIETVEAFALAQLLVLLLATALLWWSPLAQRHAPLPLRRERVHEAALHQFLARGIHTTANRTGVLIHASVHDHVVEVIADQKIYERVPADHWAATAAALLSGFKRNDPAGGFEDAIALAGAVLAEHFPPTGENPDELPNHLLVV